MAGQNAPKFSGGGALAARRLLRATSSRLDRAVGAGDGGRLFSFRGSQLIPCGDVMLWRWVKTSQSRPRTPRDGGKRQNTSSYSDLKTQ
jgi:hypothetical protein